LLFLLDVDDLAAFVEAAVWADCMRQTHFTAIAALNQVAGFQRIVGTTAVSATWRNLPFRLGGHDPTPSQDLLKTNDMHLPYGVFSQ
jgi:hypothetical protein